MNSLQWVIVGGVLLVVAIVLAVVVMATVMVYQEHQYKLRQKYAPQTDEELEERATALIAEVLKAHDARRERDQERRENGQPPTPPTLGKKW